MSLTLNQLIDLGFKPCKKESPFKKKYDTLIFSLNKTDYLELGYDSIKKQVNNKVIWKSFQDPITLERIRYVVITIGNTGFQEMKDYLDRSIVNSNYKPTLQEQEYLDGNE